MDPAGVTWASVGRRMDAPGRGEAGGKGQVNAGGGDTRMMHGHRSPGALFQHLTAGLDGL